MKAKYLGKSEGISLTENKIYEVLGFKEKAIKAYKKCNDYDPAKERLKNLR